MRSLNGDLSQMYEQKKFLELRGFKLTVNGGIPSIDGSDYPQAIKLLYTYQISGWWNYKEDLILLDICTEEQFIERLG